MGIKITLFSVIASPAPEPCNMFMEYPQRPKPTTTSIEAPKTNDETNAENLKQFMKR